MERKNVISTTLAISSQVSGALGNVNPAFIGVSIITGIVNELIGYQEASVLEKRLNMLENEIHRRDIEIDRLKEIITELDENAQFVLRNNIKYFCLSALPDTTDAYCKCIVTYLLEDNHDMEEELCELLQQCNSNDVHLLQMIKKFPSLGVNKAYELEKKKIIKQYEDHEKNPSIYRDRSYIFDENTIFWQDFMEAFHVNNVNDMTVMLNRCLVNDKNERVYDWAYLARSVVKLQGLGILQIDYRTMLGTNSLYNIDRFHLTLFGQKLIQYI